MSKKLKEKSLQKYDEKVFNWFVKLNDEQKEAILNNESLGELLHDRIYHAYMNQNDIK